MHLIEIRNKTFIWGILFFIHILSAGFVYAVEVTGEGVGFDKKQAEKEALVDLCQKIQVEVMSQFTAKDSIRQYDSDRKSGKEDTYIKNVSKTIRLSSDLPLLGVTYETVKKRKEYITNARLDDRELPLYQAVLTEIKKKVDAGRRELLKSDSRAAKKALLCDLLVEMDRFEKYAIVYLFLGGKPLPDLPLTEAEIKSQLVDLNPIWDSLEDGLKKIAKQIPKEKIYIYPPTTRHSSEITEFSGKVKDTLTLYLKTVQRPDQGESSLQGEYTILKNNNLELIYRLMDRNQNTTFAVMGYFSKNAYQPYETEPKTVDFDRLLKSGLVLSGDFRANITTSSGKKELMFRNSDVFKILVKLNQPGYFYLIAHNLKEEEKYSYLVDFYASPGDRKFIYYINADDVNKWVEIGEFEVVPPFGVESVQMIASTRDPVNSLPETFFDPETKLYKVGASPEKVVAATRGIIRKRRANAATENQVEVSEDILTLTTLK